jgi:hypothetical protein
MRARGVSLRSSLGQNGMMTLITECTRLYAEIEISE